MRAINYHELKRRFDLDGPRRTVEHLTEALRHHYDVDAAAWEALMRQLGRGEAA